MPVWPFQPSEAAWSGHPPNANAVGQEQVPVSVAAGYVAELVLPFALRDHFRVRQRLAEFFAGEDEVLPVVRASGWVGRAIRDFGGCGKARPLRRLSRAQMEGKNQ